MHFLSFAIIYPIIWIVSRFPMRILYGISNVLFFFVFYVFKYRKKVVENNIQMAFPEKSEKEVKSIAKKFFLHFTDLIVESIKSFSISKKEIQKRYKYQNIELVHDLIDQGKSVILTGAHQANWEWSFYIPSLISIPMFGAYTKLRNTYFDNKIKESRTKFGGNGFKSSHIIKGMQKNHNDKLQALYLLLSDQSPQLSRTQYWTNFFNINLPVHIGPEMLAKRFNYAVVNYATVKTKRGYFETSFELIAENPKDSEKYEITDKYIELTEKNIRIQPECYLWSHKRFKHKDKYEQWVASRKKKK